MVQTYISIHETGHCSGFFNDLPLHRTMCTAVFIIGKGQILPMDVTWASEQEIEDGSGYR